MSMSEVTSLSIGRCLSSASTGLRRWHAKSRLRGDLSRYSRKEIDHLLAAADMTRADLYRVSKDMPQHRLQMIRLMAHFGVDIERAVYADWDRIRRIDRACAICANQSRCRRWLAWGRRNDAPRLFCPGAPSFEMIAHIGPMR